MTGSDSLSKVDRSSNSSELPPLPKIIGSGIKQYLEMDIFCWFKKVGEVPNVASPGCAHWQQKEILDVSEEKFSWSSQGNTCGQGCHDNEDALRTSRNNLALEIDAFELDLDLASSVDGHR